MDDIRRFLPLSSPQFQILLALTDAERHGYGIIQEIAARSRGTTQLGTGTLYTAVAGLVDSGLIADSSRRLSTRDDPRRKYYRLTPLGRRVLEAEAERLETLVREAKRKGVRAARPALSRLSSASRIK
jgi:DNA-binding PadR family transcriptional regulator